MGAATGVAKLKCAFCWRCLGMGRDRQGSERVITGYGQRSSAGPANKTGMGGLRRGCEWSGASGLELCPGCWEVRARRRCADGEIIMVDSGVVFE